MKPPRADRDIRDGANASPTPSSPRDFACVTWNVHRGRGRDGRVDPERIARVLINDVLAESVDVLALQEADAECPPHAGILDIGAIEAATGLRHAHSERALRWGDESHGFLGSILFVAPRSKRPRSSICRGIVIVARSFSNSRRERRGSG
jgi:endonuclease/exonuclease/phosphatase family metal-dependent hydrolase